MIIELSVCMLIARLGPCAEYIASTFVIQSCALMMGCAFQRFENCHPIAIIVSSDMGERRLHEIEFIHTLGPSVPMGSTSTPIALRVACVVLGWDRRSSVSPDISLPRPAGGYIVRLLSIAID